MQSQNGANFFWLFIGWLLCAGISMQAAEAGGFLFDDPAPPPKQSNPTRAPGQDSSSLKLAAGLTCRVLERDGSFANVFSSPWKAIVGRYPNGSFVYVAEVSTGSEPWARTRDGWVFNASLECTAESNRREANASLVKLPASASGAKPQPSVEDTIEFIESHFQRAASLTKAKYFRYPNSRQPSEETFAIRLFVDKDAEDFVLYFRDTRSGPRGFYSVEVHRPGYHPMFEYTYSVRLSDVELALDSSDRYVGDDERTYLSAIRLTCRIGTCVSGYVPSAQNGRLLRFAMVESDLVRRIGNALKSLQARVPRKTQPF